MIEAFRAGLKVFLIRVQVIPQMLTLLQPTVPSLNPHHPHRTRLPGHPHLPKMMNPRQVKFQNGSTSDRSRSEVDGKLYCSKQVD